MRNSGGFLPFESGKTETKIKSICNCLQHAKIVTFFLEFLYISLYALQLSTELEKSVDALHFAF